MGKKRKSAEEIVFDRFYAGDAKQLAILCKTYAAELAAARAENRALRAAADDVVQEAECKEPCCHTWRLDKKIKKLTCPSSWHKPDIPVRLLGCGQHPRKHCRGRRKAVAREAPKMDK